MIEPINGNVLITPLKHSTYLPTEKGTYEEVGIVTGVPKISKELEPYMGLEIGTKVFFDGWTASKYPTGENDEYFWLVPFADIKAVEKQGDAI